MKPLNHKVNQWINYTYITYIALICEISNVFKKFCRPKMIVLNMYLEGWGKMSHYLIVLNRRCPRGQLFTVWGVFSEVKVFPLLWLLKCRAVSSNPYTFAFGVVRIRTCILPIEVETLACKRICPFQFQEIKGSWTFQDL